jgi:hypothetical protein
VIGGWEENREQSATSFMYQSGFRFACALGHSRSGQGSVEGGMVLMQPVARGSRAKHGGVRRSIDCSRLGGAACRLAYAFTTQPRDVEVQDSWVVHFAPRSPRVAVIGKAFEALPRDLPAKLPALSLDDDTLCLVALAGAWLECAFPGGGVCVKSPVGSGVPVRVRYLAVLGRAVVWETLTGPRGCALILPMARQYIGTTETFTWYTWPSAHGRDWQFLVVSRAREDPAQTSP